MAELSLESLGFTKEELQERVIAKLCEGLMTTESWDDEGTGYRRASSLRQKLDERVAKRIEEEIDALAQKHIFPNVSTYIENLTLQETNRWGEKQGKKTTFIEYLTARAEAYLQEEVSYEGQSKGQDSYSWRGTQTRLTFLVHQHLQYSIDASMKSSVNAVQAALAPALTETVKKALEEISKKLKVVVRTA